MRQVLIKQIAWTVWGQTVIRRRKTKCKTNLLFFLLQQLHGNVLWFNDNRKTVPQSSEWNVFLLWPASPCVKDKLADIVERTIQIACWSCPVQSLFTRTWLAFLCSLVISVQVGGCVVWACVHVSIWLLTCMFSQSQGVMEQIAQGDPYQPAAANPSQQ